ncbi:MAG: hypothetical protein IPN69_01395 [Acidobacteria bacterium]|nr:hypothetical protein [Acidobacteriota bacterium]MBK8809374.1 hypothetical protein [Acidobacteriota bacterium]
MRNKSIVKRYLCLSLVTVGLVLIAGSLNETNAQCNGDPFCTPSWKQPKKQAGATTPGATKPTKPGPPPVIAVLAPPIEQRIAFYKQQRETAVVNGLPVPKVTSVLTLDELAITGIFKTPRGYAAMVEAVPIKLSYTIYPGEKFFDGQLVAIEDNRAVFRKVTKMSNSKFITAVENKTLREYTVQQEVQGTAPVQQNSQQTPGQTEVVNNSTPTQPQTAPTTTGSTTTQVVTPGRIVSPVDEMNNQPVETPKDSVKDSKKSKKPVRTAKKS